MEKQYSEKLHELDKHVFSSGKQIYPNRSFIGINDRLEISYGYDTQVLYSDWSQNKNPENFSFEQKNELADYMIGLWERFKLLTPEQFKSFITNE